MIAQQRAELPAAAGAVLAQGHDVGLCLKKGKDDSWEAGGPAAVLDVPREQAHKWFGGVPGGRGVKGQGPGPRDGIA